MYTYMCGGGRRGIKADEAKCMVTELIIPLNKNCILIHVPVECQFAAEIFGAGQTPTVDQSSIPGQESH